MKKSDMGAMTTKEMKASRSAKKVMGKKVGKKSTVKRMVKPALDNGVKNPENKFVWKPFGR